MIMPVTHKITNPITCGSFKKLRLYLNIPINDANPKVSKPKIVKKYILFTSYIL